MLRPKVGRLWGNSSAVARRDPGDAKYLTGWLSEIPTYQVLNYLQWKTDSTFLALAERGVLEWGGDVTYKKGAAAWDELDGKVYIATLNGPDKTKAPSTNSAQWTGAAIQLSRAAYDATVAKINAHIADVTSNPHKLTPGRLGTYTTAQIDALVAQYRAEVQTHASDKNNPHKVTASQIGAVPVEGGNYTGNVTMDTGQVLLSSDGKRLIKADATGVYLKNDAGAVGVDASGKGFVKIGTAAASEIITQATFADNKAVVEPSFAIPAPIFYMPLLRDINIYVGGGTVDSSSAPQFDAGGRLMIVNQNLTLSSSLLVGKTDVTICLDIVCPMGTPTALTSSQIGLGSTAKAKIGILANGTVQGVVDSDVTDARNIADGKVHRVAITRNATALSLYIDGLWATAIGGTFAAFDASALLMQYAANPMAAYICNLRIWDSVLTDNQVSNL